MKHLFIKGLSVTLISYKLLAALLIFIVSISATIYPLKVKLSAHPNESLDLGEAFASGIFLGLTFFHMLPEANNIFRTLFPLTHLPLAEFICVSGFIALLFLERLALTPAPHSGLMIPYLLSLIIIIHSFIEGMAFGINTSTSTALMLFLAILTHKGSDSFTLCMTLLHYPLTIKRILYIALFAAFMTPIGIGIGVMFLSSLHAGQGKMFTALFTAFAAGIFLYMSTLHHMQFHERTHRHDEQGKLEFLFLLIGLAIMGGVTIWS